MGRQGLCSKTFHKKTHSVSIPFQLQPHPTFSFAPCLCVLLCFCFVVSQKIAKGPEENEGTLKPAWKGLLTEADELSEIHARTDTQLRETVQQEVAKRKKETFTRQLRGWRVSKVGKHFVVMLFR